MYGEECKIAAMTDEECMKYDAEIRKAGWCKASEPLQQVETAKNVRVREGKVSIVDGPFVETKESLAGNYLVDVKDMNEALEIAARIPPAQVRSIEVQPLRELVITQGKHRDKSSAEKI